MRYTTPSLISFCQWWDTLLFNCFRPLHFRLVKPETTVVIGAFDRPLHRSTSGNPRKNILADQLRNIRQPQASKK